MIFSSEGGAWWDYPGFELWKFVNLFVFVAILVYILTRKVKLGEAFRTRREQIKRELQRAQQERDAALAKLKEVEERLARLDTEVATIREQSQREAAEERERIAKSTELGNRQTRRAGETRNRKRGQSRETRFASLRRGNFGAHGGRHHSARNAAGRRCSLDLAQR